MWRGLSGAKDERPKPEEKPQQTSDEERVERLLADLTLEEKVAQLFVVTPEQLTGVDVAIEAGPATREAVTKRPVGGVIYFSQNLEDPKQTTELLRNTKNYVKDACGLTPFLCVDEEGGTVVRIADNPAFGQENVGDMAEFGANDDVEGARMAAYVMGGYLSELGFNVDLAPVADVCMTPNNVMAQRSFGNETTKVAQFVSAQVDGFMRGGVLCAVKHFPGIGGAGGDSHDERIYSSRTADQMESWELVPFKAAIKAGVPMVLVGHLTCLNVGEEGGAETSSLSKAVVTDMLRGRLGYDGIVITDSMQMEAAIQACENSEQAVKAIEAGADLVLMPEDFDAAYEGLIEAVSQGRVTEKRLNQSVRRIIKVKLHMPA